MYNCDMSDTVQSDKDLDPGLVGSLRILRDPTRGTHQERLNFARALVGMYPEGADAIVAPLAGTLDEFARHNVAQGQLSSGPGTLDEFWSLLLGLPAATPQVQAIRDRAQQLFLAGVSRTTDGVTEAFLGTHGSGGWAVQNLQAIARFVHNAPGKHLTLDKALTRMEATHITRAVQAGSGELIRATLALGDPGRVMGGEAHGSWLRQWAQAARNNPPEPAVATLDALLGAGVDINTVDNEGLTALDWVLDGSKILDHDGKRLGARVGRPIHLDGDEALNVAFENSAPVAGWLLERGARWEHLDSTILHAHARAILDGHPVVRRARLGEQANTGLDRPGLGRRGL